MSLSEQGKSFNAQ